MNYDRKRFVRAEVKPQEIVTTSPSHSSESTPLTALLLRANDLTSTEPWLTLQQACMRCLSLLLRYWVNLLRNSSIACSQQVDHTRRLNARKLGKNKRETYFIAWLTCSSHAICDNMRVVDGQVVTITLIERSQRVILYHRVVGISRQRSLTHNRGPILMQGRKYCF
jgi:hypothetical protein